MLTAIIICLFIVAVFNFGIGLIVLLGGNNGKVHRLFFLLTCSVFLWVLGIALFLLADNATFAATWAAIYYSAAAFIAYFTLAFALNYPEINKVKNYLLALLLLPTLGIVAMAFIPGGLIEMVNLSGDSNVVQLNTGFYICYTIYFIAYMYGAFAVIASRMHQAIRQRERLGKQLKYILYGMMLAGTLGMLFNLFLPLFDNYRLIWVGPLFSFIYVITIFYSIIRHQLFDIRLIFARLVAYLLLLGTMAIVYAAGIFSVSAILFQGSQVDLLRNIIYVILALFLAFTLRPLKNFFDRITDKLFLRDDYDLEVVLDQLGDAIVNEIDFRRLIHKAQQTLYDALKPTFVNFVIFRNEPKEAVVESFLTGRSTIQKRAAQESLVAAMEKVLIKDDVVFRNGITDNGLRQMMEQYGVAGIMLLRMEHELSGYVFLGEKRSGSVYRRKDMQLLNTAADELVVAIQNALRFEEIQHFNKTLQGEVRDATAELRQSNRKLHELDNAKDEFISMASHQLRTPLTSVKGYLSMVLDGDVGKITTDQRKVLEEAFNSSQRMVYLIGDFLNVSRLQTGKFELERRETNLASVVDQEVRQMQDNAKSRSISIHYEAPDNFPPVSIDENKMRQVIMNFIDNAIFYTKPKDTVQVTLMAQGSEIVFKVIDRGIGVPASERHKLFTKFFRASNAKKQRPDGTGIGLFMARKVITAHGGSIIFETAEGKGSTFGFRLPIMSPDSPAQRSAK